MEVLLREIGRVIGLILEAIAITLIAIGTIESLVAVVRTSSIRTTGVQRRAVWLSLAQWLVAAMTFQLAADIVATSFSPSWDQIGRLGAIAGIRTFLSHFLDREVENTRRLQRGGPAEGLRQAAS